MVESIAPRHANWFVGIPVPARSWLPGVLEKLPGDVRGFVPEDVHMTVAFLGQLSPDRQPAVLDVLASVRSAPVHITLGRLVALPTRTRFSALSYEIDQGKPICEALIHRWRDPFIRAAHARPDHRPPRPHITIARPHRKAGAAARQRILDAIAKTSPPKDLLWLESMALFSWAWNRRERQFRIVENHRFSDENGPHSSAEAPLS